jgi:hypothetical protein
MAINVLQKHDNFNIIMLDVNVNIFGNVVCQQLFYDYNNYFFQKCYMYAGNGKGNIINLYRIHFYQLYKSVSIYCICYVYSALFD